MRDVHTTFGHVKGRAYERRCQRQTYRWMEITKIDKNNQKQTNKQSNKQNEAKQKREW